MTNGLYIFVQEQENSCIDLTYSAPRLTSDLSWHISPCLYFTDHFPIIVTHIDDTQLQNTEVTTKYEAQANWKLYAQPMCINYQ